MANISIEVSDELKELVDQVAREEGREQFQVGSSALELYASLPNSARVALLEIAASEIEAPTGAMELVAQGICRVLLGVKRGILNRQVAEEIREKGMISPDLTEEEIAELAVRITSAAE